MRRLVTSAACALVCAGVVTLRAQQPPPAQPPPVQSPPAPPPASQQQPVFRTEIDVIRLDVSVLDEDRRPVRGLTAGDFTVYENGKLQQVVAVAEIDAVANDPAPSAWMRYVPRDVTANNLADQAGDGRVIAIVIDDRNTPLGDPDIVMGVRAIGRHIIDRLGSSDVAAVIFARDPGKTEDFTDDRGRLLAAIDKVERPEFRWTGPKPTVPTGGGADMPYRSSPALMRSNCQLGQPTVPTLDTIASRLATIPNRRKTIFLVSTGVPLNFGDSRSVCASELAGIMRDVFRKSQRGNINIYSIDPAGYRGAENYLQNLLPSPGRPAARMSSPRAGWSASSVRHDFLEITAEHTGARAIVNTDDIEGEIDRVFEEAGAYYLVGYRTSNGKPDGKFRKLEVKVKRPDVTVRTRSGYYAPREGSLVTAEAKLMPSSINLGLTGLMTPAALPLRAAVLPLARTAGPASQEVDVGVVLTVRLPPTRVTLAETLTVVRTIYDAEGRAGAPIPERLQLTLAPNGGDEVRYDVYQRLTLAPGRYSIRLNGTSTALDKSGSVYADFEVPDFTRSAVSASAIVVGTRPDRATRTDVLALVLPVLPTSAREFSPNEQPVAFLRMFQGGTSPLLPVSVTTQMLDLADAKVHDSASLLEPEAFDASRSAPFEVALPISRLTRGPYLVTITATLPGGASTRRDLVVRVR